MKTIDIIIGANYGDEGKGATVQDIVKQYQDCIVVRANGGANASHTVINQNHRHAFQHFGSGTFLSVPTFLTEHYIVNPILFKNESDKLVNYKPKVYVHENCLVTTPYHMVVNQLKEQLRNGNLHGSCGVGINETISFFEKIRVTDLLDFSTYELREKLHFIKSSFKHMYSQHNVPWFNDFINDHKVMDRFINEVKFFLDSVTCEDSYDIIQQTDHVVFEGAQGLALDEHHGYFPHVTRSNTGIKNPFEIIRNLYLSNETSLKNVYIRVYYVTRSYLTRHGAGPLELPAQEHDEWNCLTNIVNQNQGKMRYCDLNLDNMFKRIETDKTYGNGFEVDFNLVINWMDVFKDKKIPVFYKNRMKQLSPDEFLDIINKHINVSFVGVAP